jgi:hypothetical protein
MKLIVLHWSFFFLLPIQNLKKNHAAICLHNEGRKETKQPAFLPFLTPFLACIVTRFMHGSNISLNDLVLASLARESSGRLNYSSLVFDY